MCKIGGDMKKYTVLQYSIASYLKGFVKLNYFN